MLEEGKTYNCTHRHKGTFMVKVLKLKDEWVSVQIVKGRIRDIPEEIDKRGYLDYQSPAFELLLSMCKFVPLTHTRRPAGKRAPVRKGR